ncbi:MAG: caspase family protein [Microcystaceae cyanobacterium]
MQWDRRTVLKTLVSLGLSQIVPFEKLWQPSRWRTAYTTLAASNARKLALLVGVNHYGQSPALKGCLTDVELQRDLLHYRFGFQPEDIIVLTGDKATREGIENTFLEHLVEQAKAEDVVLFHYSGYGSQVKVPKEASEDEFTLVNGLLPSDSILPSKGMRTLNNILLDTIYLLGRSLATDKFTCILDTSYGLPSPVSPHNFPLRSSSLASERLNSGELAFQEQLKRNIKNYSAKALNKGSYLFAAQDQDVAAELILKDVQAGLFTYLLTQYLWEVTSANRLIFTLQEVDQGLKGIMGEKQISYGQETPKSAFLTYYSLPEVISGAEGVIVKRMDADSVKIHLTGLPYLVLNEYGVNSHFRIINEENSSVTCRIRSRTGRVATADLITKNATIDLTVGQLLQEQIRVFNKEIGLSIAIDKKLQRIERVDATSALSSIKIVQSVHNIGEEWADCILGKTETGDYGLFSAGGNLLVKTEGTENEAIKSAVERLNSYFKEQLAWKWYQLTENEGSSQLDVLVSLETVGKPSQPLSQRQPQRTPSRRQTPSIRKISPNFLSDIPKESPLQYRINNYSDRPISVLLVALTPSHPHLLGLLHPNTIPSGESEVITFSAKNDLSAIDGIYQVKVICCAVPLDNLRKAFESNENSGLLHPFSDSLSIMQSLLQDIHTESESGLEDNTLSDAYILDVNHWATLNFVYQVI